MNAQSVEKQIGEGKLSIETGIFAKQAAGSCLVRYQDTVVLVAVATGPGRPGIDFFPLTCDYRERAAAAGKFPGGFLKREGRPSTRETLTSRLMDRPIRPMFPDWFHDEVQIQANVLASDRQNDPDILAMIGSSMSLLLSGLPFEGPVSSIRLGCIDGAFIPFPTQDQLEASELDLIVSGTAKSVTMIEGFSREMPEDKMLAAISEAHRHIQSICELQLELARKLNVEPRQYTIPESDGLFERLRNAHYEAFADAKRTPGKQARAAAVDSLKEAAKAVLIPDPKAEDAIAPAAFDKAWYQLTEQVVRDLIVSGNRPDGRAPNEIRPITCMVDVLPRVHGSAVFQRGETQAMVTVTLGTSRDEQRVDGLIDEYSKKFMLDYYFPSYSVGECRPIRGPGRREIGHGMLAERSVKPVLPEPEVFPYTIRVISDILESNGSSSMASVCGATLGLMAAGVPIKNPVAGISVGLVQQSEDKWMLLTDIIGDEDHYGDMDFKIAGTQNGITGIQLDLKLKGISLEIVKSTLAQSREARIHILRNMLTVIRSPRKDISIYAPRLLQTKIEPDKIGLLIGPGGKTIRGIQETTGATIEVDDSGTVIISAAALDSAQAALDMVEGLTSSVQVGKVYKGRVTSIKDFGAFIEILPGKDGLCHISELSDGYVKSVSDICKIGDEMMVKVIAVDEQDRVKLSRKAIMKDAGAPAEGAGNPSK